VVFGFLFFFVFIFSFFLFFGVFFFIHFLIFCVVWFFVCFVGGGGQWIFYVIGQMSAPQFGHSAC
jgi:hypothetical protein